MCQVCVGGSDRNVSELIHLDSNLTSIDPKLFNSDLIWPQMTHFDF